MGKTVITPEIDKFIRKNYLSMSAQDIADRFGCSEYPIVRHRNKLGLIVPKDVSRKFAADKLRDRSSCTPEQDAFIKKEFIRIPPKRMAKLLGCSQTKIRTRILQLGLVLPAEILQQRIEASRIRPGSVPPNKGRRQEEYMSPEAIERSKAHQFKKGDIPATAYNEIGKITIRHEHPTRNNGRKYKYLCLALGHWVQLHVHVWTEANGPIPKGHCLWFRDNDPLNCDLGNLELITRRENLARNNLSNGAIAAKLSRKGYRTDHALKSELLKHPELIELKKQQILLNRQIKNENK